MAISRTCLNFALSLLVVFCALDLAAGDVLNNDQKDLVKDVARGAGGVLQQLIVTRGAVRAAQAQAQAQAAAALAAAQPPVPAFPPVGAIPQVVPPNLLPVNRQVPQQPVRPQFQPQLQAPQFTQAFPQQGFPQVIPPPPPPIAGLPPPGFPQPAFPQQVVTPAAIPPNPAAVPPVNVPTFGGSGPEACSSTDTSPQAVERCLNAVRTNPNAFLGQFPCTLTGLAPVKPLRSDYTLTTAAALHAQDLARMGTVGHTGSDGSDLRTRVQDRAGFPNAAVGENAAGGQHSAREVVFDWVCSEGHRKNVFSCNYDSFGTGVVPGPWPYWVQNFGCRSGSCTC